MNLEIRKSSSMETLVVGCMALVSLSRSIKDLSNRSVKQVNKLFRYQ